MGRVGRREPKAARGGDIVNIMRCELVYCKVYNIGFSGSGTPIRLILELPPALTDQYTRRYSYVGADSASPDTGRLAPGCLTPSPSDRTTMPQAMRTRPATVTASTPRTTRGDRIARAYDQLRELIIWGRLAPGSRIIESDIAERLGVSRTPVRSALHRLQQEGWITGVGRRKEHRLVIAPLTREDARELFDVVGAVEGLAARGAAALPPATRKALAEDLRSRNAQLAPSGKGPRPDPVRIFDLDTGFHRRYVEAGAGPRLLALHDAVKPQAERYVRLYTSALVDEIGQSVVEHAAIIDRIAAGSAEGAQKAVERNWRNAAARLTRVIVSLGERGSW